MPQLQQQQQYKLRLTEGTQLLVDHDALGVWINDEKALVQPPGSQRWRLLSQFLADEQARRSGAPRRPRVTWADGGPGGDSAPSTPPEYGDDETFGPDLSETDAPWEWPQEPEPPAAASAALAPPPHESEIVEPEFPDFEFPNDDILTLDDLVAPREAPAAPATSEAAEAAPDADADEEPEVAPVLSDEAMALAASCGETLPDPLDEPPAAPDAAPLDHESVAPEDMLAHIAERAFASVQVLADGMSAQPGAAGDGIAKIPLKALDPEPLRRADATELAAPEEPVEAVVWGDGLLGWFCCTVADWSDRIADWIDRVKNATARRREDGARVQHVPADGRPMLAAWQELIEGWWSQLRR
jgi:hypothetical protein